ncbi:MAG: AAA family ATPase [Armatimonadetes bacterium]|jgi:wobble nucleotide-excising tRNase|nr:AAA family ATPase [Armatimonadota bacterium]
MLNTSKPDSSKRINKICLTKFRGATAKTELNFDTNKPVTVIFGENGTGKSTIVDAIDFVCNKSGGSVAERSSTTIQKHLPSLGSEQTELQVEVHLGGNAWKGNMSGRDIVTVGPTPNPSAHILRRSQLLRLIEARPADRFGELKRFIDVEGIERCEDALIDAARVAKQRYDEAVKAKVEAEDYLQKLWEAEGKPDSPSISAVGWAAAKSAADMTVVKAQHSAISELLQQLNKCETEVARLEKYNTDLSAARNVLANAQKDAAKAPTIEGEDGVDIVDILEKGKIFIAAHNDRKACPLCENPIVAADLLNRINARLSAMTNLSTINERLQSAERDVELAKKQVASTTEDVLLEAGKLFQSLDALCKAQIDDCPVSQSSVPETDMDENGKAMDIKQVAATLSALSGNKAKMQMIEKQLSSDIEQFNAVSLHYERMLENEEKVRDTKAVSEGLEKASEIVRSKRLKFSQNILNEVSAECNRIYEKLHPGESLGDLRLYLDDKKKGSLYQDATFLGAAEVPPQAYFSESHLDTLGFAMFLAVAKHYSNGDAIVVLDDIFTSVDAVHLTRIIDLLADESSSFNHLIITTHFRQWRDRYRLSQAPGRAVQLVELHRWSRNNGVRMYNTKLQVDELKVKLASEPFARQSVAAESGILLEAVLDHVSMLYGCAVPHRRSGDFTLGELLDSVAKLSKVLIVKRQPPKENGVQPPAVEIQIKPLYDKVSRLAFIRNQVGCHFNVDGSEIANTDVEAFGKNTLDFVNALVCPTCGSLARRQAGDHYRCQCGGVEMRPLERP